MSKQVLASIAEYVPEDVTLVTSDLADNAQIRMSAFYYPGGDPCLVKTTGTGSVEVLDNVGARIGFCAPGSTLLVYKNAGDKWECTVVPLVPQPYMESMNDLYGGATEGGFGFATEAELDALVLQMDLILYGLKQLGLFESQDYA